MEIAASANPGLAGRGVRTGNEVDTLALRSIELTNQDAWTSLC